MPSLTEARTAYESTLLDKMAWCSFFFYQFLTSSKIFIPQGYVPKTKITIQIPPEIVEGAW